MVICFFVCVGEFVIQIVQIGECSCFGCCCMFVNMVFFDIVVFVVFFGGFDFLQECCLVMDFFGFWLVEILVCKVDVVVVGVGYMVLIVVVVVGGGVVVDVDGNLFIDFGFGIVVIMVGNVYFKVVVVVVVQVVQFMYICFMILLYEFYVGVVEVFNCVIFGDFVKKSVLFNLGVEVVENVIKIVCKYIGCQVVVVFDYGYYGCMNFIMVLIVKLMLYKSGFGFFVFEVYCVLMLYLFCDGFDGCEVVVCVIFQFEKQIGVDNFVVVIIEFIQGEGGFIVFVDGFFFVIVDWCCVNGVVFIVDEVQIGFVCIGYMFVSEIFGIEFDLIIMVKGIVGGFFFVVVIGCFEIMDVLYFGGFGGMYGGNFIVCVVVFVVIDVFENDGVIEWVWEIGEILIGCFIGLQVEDVCIGDVCGYGVMVVVEFVDFEIKVLDVVFMVVVVKVCIVQGVIVFICGIYGNVICFFLLLLIGDELLNEGFDVVVEVFVFV